MKMDGQETANVKFLCVTNENRIKVRWHQSITFLVLWVPQQIEKKYKNDFMMNTVCMHNDEFNQQM